MRLPEVSTGVSMRMRMDVSTRHWAAEAACTIFAEQGSFLKTVPAWQLHQATALEEQHPLVPCRHVHGAERHF